MDENKITEILIKEAFVTQEDIDKATKYATAHHISVIDRLISEGILNRNLLGQAIAESFGCAYSNMEGNPPPRELVLKIPENISRTLRCTVFQEHENDVVIATDQPTNAKLVPALKGIFKDKQINITYAFPQDLEAAFVHYRKPLNTRFVAIINQQRRIAPEIVGEIVNDAIILHASDIHFEPQEKEVLVRFRIDGTLREAGRIPKTYYENILNRIKVQARLPIDEHYSALDGAIRFQREDHITDLRVSIVPTLDGEKVAIRILGEYIRNFNLSELGLSPADQAFLLDKSKKSYGMILTCGPTGSGKTTTLYGLLKILNHPELNITTIEDPVEYKIAGVNHIQVNAQTGLTFANGLRTIVRQDPNVILVGEIRDKETAEIAVNAALTGHLLLSTFHANDAATAIPRLVEMGIEPYLLATTLEIIIGQRLVKRVCQSCRYSKTISPTEAESMFVGAKNIVPKKGLTVYMGKGCDSCGGTGYRGRIALYEIIRNNPELADVILKNTSSQKLWEVAKKHGSKSLFEDGLEKVKSGQTTLEEVLRVAPPQIT